jgi:hypothetical protein
MAQRLGVPVPVLSPAVHSVNQLGEFETSVASDPQCIAARLAQTDGPTVGGLYRFGLIAGYAGSCRAISPKMGAVFIPELRYYGEAAGVPSELVDALAEDPSAMSTAEREESALAWRKRMGTYLLSVPGPLTPSPQRRGERR